MRHLLTAGLCSLFLLFAFRSPVQFVVSGRVTDASGSPIPYASITVKGKPIATTTKDDGTFQLTINSEKAVLIISAVGCESKQVEVSSANPTVTISLAATKLLGEVVVTAIGIRKQKKALGYNSKSIRSEEISSAPVYSDQFFSPKENKDNESRNNNDLEREGYDAIIENRFLKSTDNPLSTFSIDVDAASYSNVRRMLNGPRACAGGLASWRLLARRRGPGARRQPTTICIAFVMYWP